MSTAYITTPDIKWKHFWKNLPPSLEELVVPQTRDEHGRIKDSGTTTRSRCITDGISKMWCSTGDARNGTVSFTRYGIQFTIQDIIAAIEEHFGVELIDEHDDRYWEGIEDEDEEVEVEVEG